MCTDYFYGIKPKTVKNPSSSVTPSTEQRYYVPAPRLAAVNGTRNAQVHQEIVATVVRVSHLRSPVKTVSSLLLLLVIVDLWLISISSDLK